MAKSNDGQEKTPDITDRPTRSAEPTEKEPSIIDESVEDQESAKSRAAKTSETVYSIETDASDEGGAAARREQQPDSDAGAERSPEITEEDETEATSPATETKDGCDQETHFCEKPEEEGEIARDVTSAEDSFEASNPEPTGHETSTREASDQSARGDKAVDEPKKDTRINLEINNGRRAQLDIFPDAKTVVNNYYQPAETKGADPKSLDDPEDPTAPLPTRHAKLPALGLSRERGDILVKLKREHAVILSSRHHDVARAAAYSIIDDVDLGDCQKLAATFGGSKGREGIPIDFFVDHKFERSNTAILVDVDSQVFFDSLQCSPVHASVIKERLVERGIFLVCAVSSSSPDGLAQEVFRPNTSFEIFDIPFLQYLLASYFEIPEARKFERKIRDQHHRGLWGDKNDDADLYAQILRCSKKGSRGIREAVEKRELLEAGDVMKRVSFPEEIQPPQARDLFRAANPIARIVIYVGVFFPGLSIQEFRSLVTHLLGNEEIISEETERIVTKKKRRIKTVPRLVERTLREVWERDCDALLDRCFLHAVDLDDGSQVVDFDLPNYRHELRRNLENKHSMFLQSQLGKLQDSGLLFAAKTGPAIRRGLIRLLVERAISEPLHYDASWMIKLMLSVRESSVVKLSPGEDPLQHLYQVLEAMEKDNLRRSHLYDRLSDLIREMLKRTSLRRTVETFLSTLIGKFQEVHAEVLELVLRIAHRLQLAPRFEPFRWLKRLIDQGDSEIKERTYQALRQLARHYRLRIYEVLAALDSWLPESDRAEERYSPSNRYAFRFFFDYCLGTSIEVSDDQYGRWPSQYPLFAALSDDETTAGDRLDLLAHWLCHPGLVSVFDESPDRDRDRADFIVGILELWLLIVEGFESKEARPNAVSVTDNLLRAISRHVDRPLRRDIYKGLRKQQQRYRSLAASIEASRRGLRRELRERRLKIMGLRRRLMQFENDSPPSRSEELS